MAQNRQRQASLDDLGARIARAKDARRPVRSRASGAMRGWELAFRMVIELVVGIAIGSAMGYGLDTLLGTLPVFLLVFGLLGFAAGVRVMMRSAEEAQRRLASTEDQAGAPGGTAKGADGGDGKTRGSDHGGGR
ncbi:MAG: AtpZ/AtpI family protein [Pseudomonadota bacterium]